MLIGLVALTVTSFADKPIRLTPGMTAPPLKVAGWAKGKEPVRAIGRLRLIDFWATWCGPCRTSIPHLTELAKKYKGRVDVFGVSVWEEGDDRVGQVIRFVAGFGARMDYPVAYDTAGNRVSEAWVRAAERPGLPQAFLIDGKNRVLWIGNPMFVETPLRNALAGTLDMRLERAKFVAELTARRAEARLQAEMGAAGKLIADGRRSEGLKAFDQIASRDRRSAESVLAYKLLSVYKPGTPESDAVAGRVLVLPKGPASVAQFVVQFSTPDMPDAYIAACRRIGLRLVDNGKDAKSLFAVGGAFATMKDKESAVKAFDAALAAAEADPKLKSDRTFLDAVRKQKADVEKGLTFRVRLPASAFASEPASVSLR